MTDIGGRLREEREHLGLSQPELAEIAETSRHTVMSWEQGKTSPDAARLIKMGVAGMDVVYILTGQRGGVLAPDESALLDNYRHSAPDSQRILRETSAAFAQPVSGKRKRA